MSNDCVSIQERSLCIMLPVAESLKLLCVSSHPLQKSDVFVPQKLIHSVHAERLFLLYIQSIVLASSALYVGVCLLLLLKKSVNVIFVFDLAFTSVTMQSLESVWPCNHLYSSLIAPSPFLLPVLD